LAENVAVAAPGEDGGLPVELGGVAVEVNGRPAGLIFVSPTQINFVVPAETKIGLAEIAVVRPGSDPSRATLAVPVIPVAPALFVVSCLHPDRAAAINAITYEHGPFCATTPEI